MKLIVGLGNPGYEYEKNRHNAGFMALDALVADQNPSGTWKTKHHALIQEFITNQAKILCVKPQTFMNNSGTSVAEIVSYYQIKLDDVLVVYDDFDIPLGEIRARKTGSSGGHNGMQSIIDALNTEDIPRIRLGIGNKDDEDFVSKRIPRDQYVLANFTSEEKKVVDEMIRKAEQTILEQIS